MRWEKELSRSDAQVKTQGWLVPYIRLTRSGHIMDTQTWFRNTFFAGLNWAPGFFGEHAVEQTYVTFHVSLPGKLPEYRQLLVTHDDGRGRTGKNTPNTWVHWDDVTQHELRANDYAGYKIVLERSNNGDFFLTIS